MASVSQREARVRANALAWGEPPTDAPRRRPGRIVAGAVLLVVCGWVAAAVYLSVGSRKEVVAVARPVERFEELSRDDLTVVRVAADSDISLVSGGDVDELVGRVAGTELVEGALLHSGQLLDADERVVGPSEATVGAVLAPQDSPGNLAAGLDVEIVLRPASSGSEEAETLRGWVLKVGEVDAPGVTGQRVTLVVPRSTASSVAASASESRVSVAVVGP